MIQILTDKVLAPLTTHQDKVSPISLIHRLICDYATIILEKRTFEANPLLQSNNSIALPSYSDRRYIAEPIEPENPHCTAFKSENFALSATGIDQSSDPLVKSMMMSVGSLDQQASSTENSRGYPSNEICASEVLSKDLCMLINAGNLSSRQPDDETQNKKRGANPWENLQLTENNSLQGMSVQNLKQLTLLDMGITLNSNKKALNDAIGNDAMKTSQPTKKWQKLYPTGQLSKRRLRRQLPENDAIKETEKTDNSKPQKQILVMGAEHGFLTELRHINFFNHPLAKV